MEFYLKSLCMFFFLNCGVIALATYRSTACLKCSLFRFERNAEKKLSIETMLNAFANGIHCENWTKGANKWLSIYYAHVQRDKRISYALAFTIRWSASARIKICFFLFCSSIDLIILNKQTEQKVRVRHRTLEYKYIEFFSRSFSFSQHTLNRKALRKTECI